MWAIQPVLGWTSPDFAMLAACRNQCQRGFPGWLKTFSAEWLESKPGMPYGTIEVCNVDALELGITRYRKPDSAPRQE